MHSPDIHFPDIDPTHHTSNEGSDRPSARTAIDGVSIDELVRRYGSPLFVYSESTVRRKFRQMHDALASRYSNVELGWSYKTNYLQAICALMHQEGALAEIVSTMEYEKAKSLGVPGTRIVFNGPHKPMETLEAAIKDGVQVHIDHFEEIDDLAQVAIRLGQTIHVGLRLNLDAGIDPRWSRFGFNLESGQAAEAVARIDRSKRLKLSGLHCHIGTFVLDPSAYRRAVEKMVAFGYAMGDAHGVHIESIDVGGGFASQSQLTTMPRLNDRCSGDHRPDLRIPTADDYATQICGALLECLKPGHRPKLIVESGRALIDEAGYLITSVLAAKPMADGTTAYVVDAGVNLLGMSSWFQFHVETDRPASGRSQAALLYGPLCMNTDAISQPIALPPLQRGQRLIVSPVGAYNNTQWMQFIEYRPNVVMVCADGSVELIRAAEDLTDIHRREILPDRWAH